MGYSKQPSDATGRPTEISGNGAAPMRESVFHCHSDSIRTIMRNSGS